jgi:hypothetical protein
LFLKEDFNTALEVYSLLLKSETVTEAGMLNERLGDVYARLNNINEALVYWRRSEELGGGSENLHKKIINEAYIE